VNPVVAETADDISGQNEPEAAELDMPGPDDPVAWSYVADGTPIVGPDGEELGTVAAMLGTETENIFHGIAVMPTGGGATRVVPADVVTGITSSRVRIAWGADRLSSAEEYRSIQG
jgi:hypothetical protein